CKGRTARSVVEVRTGDLEQFVCRLEVDLAREVAGLDERLELLLGCGQPGGERLGLVLVVSLVGNGQVRAAPVSATVREDIGDVPAGDIRCHALDVSEEPARAEGGGEGSGCEASLPVRSPLLEAGGEPLACGEN